MATKKRTKTEKEERAKALNGVAALAMMIPSKVNAALVGDIHQKTNFGTNDFGEDIKLDIKSAAETMETIADNVKSGDLSALEKMLACQAYSLQTIFTMMASKASNTTNPDHIELLSKIALKAQNQCRTTVATLSEMKSPKRATFIKQQNNAVNQQINQGKNSKKSDKPANELLEKTDGKRLDTRTTGETIGTNQDLETVGEVNRG